MSDKTEKDPKKNPPKENPKNLHRADKALGDAPAGGPNATERSRLAD